MKYLSAYLLSSLSGETPTGASVEKILKSVGAEVDSARVSSLIKALEGKSLDEVVAEGMSKMASMPTGGAPSVGGGSAPAAAGGKKEEKKEEKVEEKEESDDDMGFGLFD